MEVVRMSLFDELLFLVNPVYWTREEESSSLAFVVFELKVGVIEK